ncbi:MAG: NAD-binding protein [Methylovulum sp.]|nr:NAD-binding protein [Methylovulum sp.]
MKRIAIFGYSRMAVETIHRLSESEYQLMFIGGDAAEVGLVAGLGVDSRLVDFRNDDDLRAIGIGIDIDILFCFFPKDSDNVFLTISARALSDSLTIIATVDDPESAEKLLAAGANKIIDPYEICGRKTYAMLTRPDITSIMDETVFGRHDLNIAQIEILAGSRLENTSFSELKSIRKHNVILVGVVDRELGDELHLAVGEKEHKLDAGDVLVVMGSSKDILAFKEDVGSVCVETSDVIG